MANGLARKVGVELRENGRVVVTYRNHARYLSGALGDEIALQLKAYGMQRGTLQFRKTAPSYRVERRTLRTMLALGVRGGALLVTPHTGSPISGPLLASTHMCEQFQRFTGLEPGSARWVTLEAAA